MAEPSNRRPLASRNTGWAARAARVMLASGLTPNAISVIGIGFAALGAWALIEAPNHPWLYLAAILGIQLRLLCNMLDGMVAVEGGKGSATGPLYNEAPDRIEDSLLLVAAGYATPWWWIGWLAALLAMFTAYVRALGGSLGFGQDFRGPMAKPHRMAALTLGCLAALGEALWLETRYALAITLGIVVVGAALTGIRRVLGISRALREAAQ
jgi:phosphatidylglycerophosphate synthase